MTPGTHIWDVAIPILAAVVVGGTLTFFVWKSFQRPAGPEQLGDGEAPPATKWEPKKLKPIRGKSRLLSRAAFLRDRTHGNDLYVED